MEASTYRAQANYWNTHVRYSKLANDNFVSETTKSKYTKLSDSAFEDYKKNGGNNEKTNAFGGL